MRASEREERDREREERERERDCYEEYGNLKREGGRERESARARARERERARARAREGASGGRLCTRTTHIPRDVTCNKYTV